MRRGRISESRTKIMKAALLAVLAVVVSAGCGGSSAPQAPTPPPPTPGGGGTLILAGVVYGTDELGRRPLAGAMVELGESEATLGNYGRPTTDAAGRFFVGALSPRHYVARATRAGYDHSPVPVHRLHGNFALDRFRFGEDRIQSRTFGRHCGRSGHRLDRWWRDGEDHRDRFSIGHNRLVRWRPRDCLRPGPARLFTR